jgi:hypothetical protein
VGSEARKIAATGSVFFLDFALYRTYAVFSITDSATFPGALGTTTDSASRTTATIK